VAGGRGDQAIEQVGVLDLIAPAERLDDALHMAATFAGVLDEVEILVSADLLDADEHGWCPDPAQDTTANRRASSNSARRLRNGSGVFAPQFWCRSQNPRLSAAFTPPDPPNCRSWV
jgi:hypothetical protein